MSSPLGLSLATASSGGNPDYQLDVGSVLNRTFTIWFANLLPFCLVGFVVYLPVFLGLGAMTAAGSTMPLALGALNLLANILTLVLTGAVTFGVFESLRSNQVGTSAILRAGLSRLGTVFVTGLLTGLGMMLGFCALIIPGFILLARWWLAVPVAVIEDPGASAAIARSSALTEGNRWRTFALALIMGLITTAAVLFFSFLIGMIEGTTVQIGARNAQMTPWAQGLLHVVVLPFSALAAVTPAVVYHDLRVGKEGADIDELLKIFE
jgi:hypothetical protein